MNNTIILKHGTKRLTDNEYKKFSKGDTIFGNDSHPDEIRCWDINQMDEAKAELAKHRCSYTHGNIWEIEEYALEYCEYDDDEFVSGSDFEFAEEVGR